jgi:hypothetical protein
MKKILGYGLIALPLVGVTIIAINELGIKGALLCWGCVIAICACVFLGIWLLSRGDRRSAL